MMTSALTAFTVLLLVQASSSGPIPTPDPPAVQSVPTEAPQAGSAAGEKALRARLAAAAAAGAAQTVATAAQAPPKVVCGMKVIQADPAIDPKIVKTIPGDQAGMKIRRFVAPACAE